MAAKLDKFYQNRQKKLALRLGRGLQNFAAAEESAKDKDLIRATGFGILYRFLLTKGNDLSVFSLCHWERSRTKGWQPVLLID